MTSNAIPEMTLPSAKTLTHASKIGIVDDKPVMLDYWSKSLNKEVLIGVKDENDKLLVKSEEEYTSCIKKIFKVENEFIIITENSIYIVHCGIQSKKIS